MSEVEQTKKGLNVYCDCGIIHQIRMNADKEIEHKEIFFKKEKENKQSEKVEKVEKENVKIEKNSGGLFDF